MSRPNKGLEHVDSLEGDEASKARLRAVLATIAGEASVEEACALLSISPTRFDEIRREALEGALAALAPKPPGRPAAPPKETPAEEQLRAEVARLRHDLEGARIREEIALLMPGVLRPPSEAQKGGSPPKRGARSGT